MRYTYIYLKLRCGPVLRNFKHHNLTTWSWLSQLQLNQRKKGSWVSQTSSYKGHPFSHCIHKWQNFQSSISAGHSLKYHRHIAIWKCCHLWMIEKIGNTENIAKKKIQNIKRWFRMFWTSPSISERYMIKGLLVMETNSVPCSVGVTEDMVHGREAAS